MYGVAKIVVTFALVLAACGADVNEKTPSAETPFEVAERFAIALNEQDWGAIYDSLCSFNRRRMDKSLLADADGKRGVAPSRRGPSAKTTPMTDWSGRDRWVNAFEVLIKNGKRAGEGPYRVTRIKHDDGDEEGAWAYAAIETGPSGSIEGISMVREGDQWGVFFSGPGHGAGMTWDDDRWWLPK